MGFLITIAAGRRATATKIMMAVATVIMFVTAVQANDEEIDKCLDTCGGRAGYYKELLAGNFLCSSNHSNVPGNDKMYQKCELDCCGSKPDEDQVKCLCDVCMNLGFKHRSFCEKPGIIKTHISKEDCEKEVCAGNPKIKFYGIYCKAEDEEELEFSKRLMEEEG